MFRHTLGRGLNMYAVGRLGTYISQGVYTVAGPFHPFGGAVDIIVVQQEDGSFKSSPWYVKFGKFQGVLKRSEKLVDVAVNDVAVKFHMYLDSTGEAHFLKDAESDSKESLARSSAFSSGDEGSLSKTESILPIDAVESGVKITPAEGEKGESSDEKESDLELRFEGRKASYLLVQQARAADLATSEPAVAESHLPKEPSPELIAALTSLNIKNGSVAELENAKGGSAIHALVNQAAGLDTSNKAGRPGCSLVAQAALESIAKAAAQDCTPQVNNVPTNQSESALTTPSFTEGVEFGSATGNEGVSDQEMPSLEFENGTVHTIQVVRDGKEVIAKGFQLGKSESLNIRSGQIFEGPTGPRRARSESDLGLFSSGDTSPEPSTLMIASADGIVVLQTPKKIAPPPFTLQEDHALEGPHQEASPLLQNGMEGICNLERQNSILQEKVQKSDSESSVSKGETGKSLESPKISNSAVRGGTGLLASESENSNLDDLNNATIVSRSALHVPGSLREVDHGLADVLHIEEATREFPELTPDSHHLYKNSNGDFEKDVQGTFEAIEEDPKHAGLKNGMLEHIAFQDGRSPVLEKRHTTFDSEAPEKKARTLKRKVEEVGVPAMSAEISRPSTVELISSPKLKAAVERELAWRDAVQKAAAALKVAPLSANRHRPNRHLDRKLSPGGLKGSPKRKDISKYSSFKGAIGETEFSSQSKSDVSEILPEQVERRSWGWWGWRGTPSRSTSELGDKKDMKEVKDANDESDMVARKSHSVVESQDGDVVDPADTLKEGSGNNGGIIKGEKSMPASNSEAQEIKTFDDGKDFKESSSDDNKITRFKSDDFDGSKHGRSETTTKDTTGLASEKKAKDEGTSSKAVQKTGIEPELSSRRRSLLGVVFRGYDKEQLTAAASEAQPTLVDKVGTGSDSAVEVAESESLLGESSQVESEAPGAVEDSDRQHLESPPSKKDVTTRDAEGELELLQANGFSPVSGNSFDEGRTHHFHEVLSADTVISGGTSDFLEGESLADMPRKSGSSKKLEDTTVGDKFTVDDTEQNKLQEIERKRSQRTRDGEQCALEARAATMSRLETPSAELRDSLKTGGGDDEAVKAHDPAESNRNIMLEEKSPVLSSVVAPSDYKKEVSFAAILSDKPSGESWGEELKGGSSSAVDLLQTRLVDDLSGEFDTGVAPASDVVLVSGNGLVLSVPADFIDDKKSTLKSPVDPPINSDNVPTSAGQFQGTLLAAGQPLVYANNSSGEIPRVVVSQGIKDFLDTLKSKPSSGEAEESENDRDIEQDESGSENGQAERNLSDDRRVASQRSIYFDAHTSDDEEDADTRGNNLGGDEDPEENWGKSSPVAIPGSRVSSNAVFLVGEDGKTLRPVSESLPMERFLSDAEMSGMRSGFSRSLGSEPLALMQPSRSAQLSGPKAEIGLGDEFSGEEVGSDGEDIFPETGSLQSSTVSYFGGDKEDSLQNRLQQMISGTNSAKTWTTPDKILFICIELSLCKHSLKEQMGREEAAKVFDIAKISLEEFRTNGASIVTNDKLVVRVGGQYYPWAAAAPLVLGMLAFGQVVFREIQGAIPVEKLDPSPVGALVTTGSGGWKLWPFPLRRPKTPERSEAAPLVSREALMVAAGAGVDSTLMNDLVSQSDYYLRTRKHKVRSIIPTSQMLASMNLKEGCNRITFTFFTRVLGRQQVDARIYLWKWNTRVVISDVDGTITKSDVLGQVMPLVGKDWTQSGVTRLFSAIKENGYELMFLSARAISQAYLTRQFLFNLKQDGEALPDGPVVISPDGLFPSLYREVIRRAPHEFKIACLQDIRDLFPKDCNPFYAGFGNRDTDEISYLKVGIPKGKIFIINPKGEVAVNNRVDVKSYTSLHKLVDDMFPAMPYTEQEDFNSWNFWKMPLPSVDDELTSKRNVRDTLYADVILNESPTICTCGSNSKRSKS